MRNVESVGYTQPWVCTQCGVCVALCPYEALQHTATAHGYCYPRLLAERCRECGLCVTVCPAPRLLFEGEAPIAPPRQLYGPIVGYGLGWATEEALRYAASSGGLVSGLLLGLLRSGAIRGALITTLASPGCRPQTYLAHTEGEIRAASGSKYLITSFATGLQAIDKAKEGPFAVVGLPCQIHDLARAMERQQRWRDKIALRIALFCGSTKDERYQAFLARQMGLDATQLVHFAFRGEGWPGEIRGADAQGRQGRLRPSECSAIGRIWSRAKFTPPRCLLCDDPLGGQADLAVGDPWHIPQAADPLGKTLYLARTPTALALLQEAAAQDTIHYEAAVTEEELLRSVSSLLWRRFYAPSRIKIAALWARGWRETARPLPSPPLSLIARACRAFVLSRWLP